MKINLIYFEEDILHGYLNLYPWAFDETEDIKIANLLNIGPFVDDAEAEEIIANKVIDYLSPSETEQALKEWVKKIRHGGSLTVIGTDLYSLARAITSFKISSDQANELLYGKQEQDYLVKRSCLNGQGLVSYLLSLSDELVIEERSYEGFNYLVKVRRK